MPLPSPFSGVVRLWPCLPSASPRGTGSAGCPLREKGLTVTSPNRSRVVSSFTVVKGTLIEETYAVFEPWDLAASKRENLDRCARRTASAPPARPGCGTSPRYSTAASTQAAATARWSCLHRLDCRLDVWRPMLLWHMTRDEFLIRDFLANLAVSARTRRARFASGPRTWIEYLMRLASGEG